MKMFMLLFLVGGCATSGLVNLESIVKKRASFDFNCAESYITTIQMSFTHYGAQGCGQKKEYEVKCSLGPCVAHPK